MMDKSFSFLSSPLLGRFRCCYCVPWDYGLGDSENPFGFSVAVVLRLLIPNLLASGQWRAFTLKSGSLQFILSRNSSTSCSALLHPRRYVAALPYCFPAFHFFMTKSALVLEPHSTRQLLHNSPLFQRRSVYPPFVRLLHGSTAAPLFVITTPAQSTITNSTKTIPSQ